MLRSTCLTTFSHRFTRNASAGSIQACPIRRQMATSQELEEKSHVLTLEGFRLVPNDAIRRPLA